MTFWGLRWCVCRHCVVAHFLCALYVLAALTIAGGAVAAITPVVTLRALASGRAVWALFVAASVLRSGGLQTHVCGLWLAFGVKTLAVALALALTL